MTLEEFQKIAKEGKDAAFLEYVKAYDFEPRWNKWDTVVYTIIAGALALMTGAALL